MHSCIHPYTCIVVHILALFYTQTHVHMHAYVHTRIQIHKFMHVRTLHTYTHTYTYSNRQTYVHADQKKVRTKVAHIHLFIAFAVLHECINMLTHIHIPTCEQKSHWKEMMARMPHLQAISMFTCIHRLT